MYAIWLHYYLVVALAILLPIIYAFQTLYRVDKEEDWLIERSAVMRQSFFSASLESAASSYDAAAGEYVWGRTTAPAFASDLHALNAVQRATQLKELVWLSVTAGDWLVGFAVLQLHYQSTLAMHIYRRGPAGLSLAGRVGGLARGGGVWHANATGAMGPTARGHRVTFRSLAAPGHRLLPAAAATLTFADGEVRFDVRVSLPARGLRLAAAGAAAVASGMTGLVFPLGPHRAAVVYKAAAAPLTAPLTLRYSADGAPEEEVRLAEGLLAMDYTRGLLRRHTRRRWGCVSAPSGVGLHLSQGAYDVDGVSMENALFRRGRAPRFLQRAVHMMPLVPAGGRDRWAMRSEELNLTFTSAGGYGGRTQLGIVDIHMDHRWGTYSGTVRAGVNETYELHDVPGVFEDQAALW
ncbi:hypothetical protein STCU_00916 [Strigomonas culicis]|uniref:Uncharacterized protein n=1 Tax=Strigomonas culicis TaxID=28005 RepID=S9V3Z7_9TRYP|nr:hypothetical protein STCU_00916 [Strigomonas culicis]|eukprot:EPY35779.1 hypothetical protein STCU_00916 [Strigomonas culicis]